MEVLGAGFSHLQSTPYQALLFVARDTLEGFCCYLHLKLAQTLAYCTLLTLPSGRS